MTRILIVEDSATQAEALNIILTSEGFEVEVACDGEQGLERMGGKAFDLVISDILMPGMTGYDLCRKLKENPATRDIPVILLTTKNDALDIVQGLEAGADNFITKPYEPTYLAARINTILTNRRLRTEGILKVGVEIFFMGRRFVITSEKAQILDLLVSTFEDVVRTNRELKASQSALAAANKELEAFSYSVSHDLRAPLRGLDGFSLALLEEHADQLDPVGKEYLGRIRSAAQRMGQLIDDLLKLSHVTRSDIHPERVNLSNIARLVLSNIQATDTRRNVTVIVPDDLVAQGDARLLRVVLENLLGNAWKFSSKREDASIEFGCSSDEDGVVYFVRDNGAGFNMDCADKLFRPFQRLHHAEDFEGTGVGLATVRRVIDRHGGRIWAEGAVDAGATFYFTLGSPEKILSIADPQRY